jgi:mannosylglycerate hydrolase MGH1-like protein
VNHPDPAFDIDCIPFSYRGSWLNVSPIVGLHRRSDELHLVSHRTDLTAVLALVPTQDGRPVPAERRASAASLRWVTADSSVEAAFDTTTGLRLRGQGLGMTFRAADPALTPFTGTYLFRDPVDQTWTFTSYETGRRYRVTVLAGVATAEGVEALGEAIREVRVTPDGDGRWEAELEEIETARRAYDSGESFDAIITRVRSQFAAYVEALAPWRTSETPAAALASYVLWSATVEPSGFMGREAVLMSKHWMDSVWSWDHCFNALALAPGLPDVALDQFLLPFDHQDATGALPDSVTHSRVLRNYVKPPIHGWTLTLLRRRLPAALDAEALASIYDRLARWSSFWLDHRIGAGRQLPAYHHGNDSGWDNSTAFDADRVIESADLAAFLALQLDVLAGLATELGRHDEAVTWSARADELTKDMLAQLWDGERFVSAAPLTGRRSRSASLLTALPIVAGARLPGDVTAALVAQIRGLLTTQGLATEPVESEHYESDGYWRGPIWAPSTFLVENGLRSTGYQVLADEVSAQFRALCERSGFAENFDARAGHGLRDRAYTWTAAVYLILAGEYVGRTAPGLGSGALP